MGFIRCQHSLKIDAHNGWVAVDNKRAERKMGEMLVQTERQKPGQYQQRLHDDTVAPTLSDLGLTKRESAEAQMLTGISGETFRDSQDDGGQRFRGRGI